MIACPKCGTETQCRETRAGPGYTRRRRICMDMKCNWRVTTIEAPVGPGWRKSSDAAVVSKQLLTDMLRLLGDSIGRDEVVKLLGSEPLDDEAD